MRCQQFVGKAASFDPPGGQACLLVLGPRGGLLLFENIDDVVRRQCHILHLLLRHLLRRLRLQTPLLRVLRLFLTRTQLESH